MNFAVIIILSSFGSLVEGFKKEVMIIISIYVFGKYNDVEY